MFTGNRKLGLDAGEAALETATTPKGGSRRANYSLPTPNLGEVVTMNIDVGCFIAFNNRHECQPKLDASTNWRASLVPAAAVSPAPAVYTKFVAVKTLVVQLLIWYSPIPFLSHPFPSTSCTLCIFQWRGPFFFVVMCKDTCMGRVMGGEWRWTK